MRGQLKHEEPRKAAQNREAGADRMFMKRSTIRGMEGGEKRSRGLPRVSMSLKNHRKQVSNQVTLPFKPERSGKIKVHGGIRTSELGEGEFT